MQENKRAFCCRKKGKKNLMDTGGRVLPAFGRLEDQQEQTQAHMGKGKNTFSRARKKIMPSVALRKGAMAFVCWKDGSGPD